MNHKIIIVDDFFPQHQVSDLHNKLMGATFQDERGLDAVYPNICKDHQPDNAAQLLAAAHRRETPVSINLSCFRLGLSGERDDTFCHADGIYGAKWAAVVYLTKNVRMGGTTFWMHTPTGLDGMPDDSLIDLAGFNTPLWHRYMTEETKSPGTWQLAGFAGFKFNRLVTYPTNVFHSRFPNDIAAPFGSTPETGRLIWVAFYDL